MQSYGQPVYDFASNGDWWQAQRGWDLLMVDVGAPVSPATLADPSFIAAAGGLSGDAALEARDLLARIDRATAPYFE